MVPYNFLRRVVIVEVSYDKAGRLTALRDPRGNLTTYTYDQLDRRTGLTNPLNQTWQTAYADLPNGGSQVTSTNPLNYATQQHFDRLGRVQQVQYLNESPKLTPDVAFGYDALGNRAKMSEYLGGSTPIRETHYGYDMAQRLTSVGYDHDGNGTVDHTVSYEYDAGGQRTKLTLPDGKTIQYTYDAKGQLASMTDWGGHTTVCSHDNVGRLRSLQRDNGLSSQYHFDAGSRLRQLEHAQAGRTLGQFRYEVDKRGNRTQATEYMAQAELGTSIITKDNPAVQVERGLWTDSGNFKGSTNTSALLRVDVAGRELTLVMGTGPDYSIYDIYIDYSLYQSADGYATVVGETTITIPLITDGAHVLEIRNRPDKNQASTGYQVRFKQVSGHLVYDLHTWTYQYDALSRVRNASQYAGQNLSVAPPRSYAYNFDLAGNRTQQVVTINGTPTTTNYTYDAANRLTNAGMSYDAAGRMTSDGTNTYTWDRADRLLTMGGHSYAYNGLGQRLQQTVGSTVTQYLIDQQPGLWQVLTSTTGAAIERYVHGPRGIHAQQDAAGNWEHMLPDGLGSVRGVTDDAGQMLWSTQYEPYGAEFGTSGVDQTVFGFTGEPTDDNGLVHLRARYYSPQVGAFTALDPVEGSAGQVMSLNRYGYVQGNAINRIDPLGLDPFIQDLINKMDFEIIDWAISKQVSFRNFSNSLYWQIGSQPSYTPDEVAVLILGASFRNACCDLGYSNYEFRMLLEYDLRLFINGTSGIPKYENYTIGDVATVYGGLYTDNMRARLADRAVKESGNYKIAKSCINLGQLLGCTNLPNIVYTEPFKQYFRGCFYINRFDEVFNGESGYASCPIRQKTIITREQARNMCYQNNLPTLILDATSVVSVGTNISDYASVSNASLALIQYYNTNRADENALKEARTNFLVSMVGILPGIGTVISFVDFWRIVSICENQMTTVQ